MSLIVVRSWNDGPPPKIKGIIGENRSGDSSEGEIVPDHQGRFTTAPIPQFLTNGPVLRDSQFNSLPRRLGGGGKNGRPEHLNRRRGSTSDGSGGLKASAAFMDQLNVRIGKPDLVRHMSSPDSDNISDGTPPLSPGSVHKDSRYKKLTPELAATIPRRQLKPLNWMNHDNFWRRSADISYLLNNSDSNSLEDYPNQGSSPSPSPSPTSPRGRHLTSSTISDNSGFQSSPSPDHLETPGGKVVLVEVLRKEGPKSSTPRIENGGSPLMNKPPLPFLHQLQQIPAPFKAPAAVKTANTLTRNLPPPPKDEGYSRSNGKRDSESDLELTGSEPYYRSVDKVRRTPPPQIETIAPTTPEDSQEDEGNSIFEKVKLRSKSPSKSPSPGRKRWSEEEEGRHLRGNSPTLSVMSSSPKTNGFGGVSARVPVQCVNKHVQHVKTPKEVITLNGYEHGYEEEWSKSCPTRENFRGFCQDFLKEQGKSQGYEQKDGVINFEDEQEEDEDTPEEMDNSIDYLSIRGSVQVGDKSSSGYSTLTKSKSPTPPDPRPVIALDFGSKKCSFATYFKGQTYVSQQSESLFLVDLKNPEYFHAGGRALRIYFQEQNSSKLIRPNLDLRLVSKWREVVEGGGAYSLEAREFDPKGLLKGMTRFFGEHALSQLEANFGPIRNEVNWVVSIPSSWTGEERKMIREAVWETGLLKESDSLSLITDSLASFHSIEKNTNDGVLLLLDLGASYLHFGIFEYDIEIPEKWQLLGSGSELQRNSPDLTFEKLLGDLFTREFVLGFKSQCKPGWIQLMKGWDEAKLQFDPSDLQSTNFVFLPHVFSKELQRKTKMEVDEQCRAKGLSYNENGALIISNQVMVDLLTPSVEAIVTRIEKLKRQFGVEKIYMTGGGSRSRFLRWKISQSFNIKFITKDPELTTLHGALISKVPSSNKSSKIAIKSPYSLGVGVMTPFDPNLHPADKKLTRGGKDWCRDVWDSLIKSSQEIGMNDLLVRRTYVGAQPGQSSLVLPIFKCLDIPKFTTEPRVQKCCELSFDSDNSYKQVELTIEALNCEICIRAKDMTVIVDL